MGLFSGLAPGLLSAGTGYLQGKTQGEEIARRRKADDEERQARIQRDALATALMNLNIEGKQYEKGRRPFEETMSQADLEAKQALKSERDAQAERDRAMAGRPQFVKPWVKDGFPDTKEGKAEWLAIKRQEKAAGQEPDRTAERERARRIATGRGILGATGSEAQVQQFGKAFQSVRAGMPNADPGEVAFYANEGARSVAGGTQADQRLEHTLEGNALDQAIAEAFGQPGGGPSAGMKPPGATRPDGDG
ncbi:MAG: hypothetical protein ACREGL_02135, partial [Alphaproteobacteria bacterium]